MQFIFFSLSYKNRFFQQSVHELRSHRADISILKISQIIVVDLILFPTLRKVALYNKLQKGNYEKFIPFKGTLLYFFLLFSIPEPAFISASEEHLMVPCGLILSSASSSFPKGNILKLSKTTCEALDLAKGTFKMTPDQQHSSKRSLKMVEIVPSV